VKEKSGFPDKSIDKNITLSDTISIDSPSASLLQKNVALVRENADLKQLNLVLTLELTLIRHRLDELLRKRYGISSEKMDPGQLQLILEGLQSDEEIEQLEQPEPEEEETPPEAPAGKTAKKARRRYELPDHLEERIIEVEVPAAERVCAETGRPLTLIRHEETTKLDYEPGKVIKNVYRLAVYASHPEVLESRMIKAPLPAEAATFPRVHATTGLIAYLIVAKYHYHLPLYRLEDDFRRRCGLELPRKTLCEWLAKAANLLDIVYQSLRKRLLSGNYLQVDETFVQLMDPEIQGKTRRAYLWVMTCPRTKDILFRFDGSRGNDAARDFLEGFRGTIQVDGWSAYTNLVKENPEISPIYCWAHVRRKFKEALAIYPRQAGWYMAQIQKLYRQEKKARESGDLFRERAALRALASRPILVAIQQRLEHDLRDPAILPGSPLGTALRYTHPRWEGLTRFAEPGNERFEIDNNPVENGIRPSAIGKKNWLFIGHPDAGQNTALFYTLVETCKRYNIDPYAWLSDVLPRIKGYPVHQIADLLPGNHHLSKNRHQNTTSTSV